MLGLAVLPLLARQGEAGPTNDSSVRSVRVVNSKTAPVPVVNVESLADETFQQSLCFEVGSVHPFFCPAGSTNTILVGKEVVLEYVSAHCFISPGDRLVDLTLVNDQANGYVLHYFGPTLASAPSGSSEAFASVSQATRIYISPGFGASFGADVYNATSGPSASFGCSIGVSGHFLGQ